MEEVITEENNQEKKLLTGPYITNLFFQEQKVSDDDEFEAGDDGENQKRN